MDLGTYWENQWETFYCMRDFIEGDWGFVCSAIVELRKQLHVTLPASSAERNPLAVGISIACLWLMPLVEWRGVDPP